MPRRPDTANSRPMIMTTIQAGTTCSCHQRDQRGGNQHLIGNGIEQRSDGGDLSPTPGQEAIEQVGAGRSQKNGERQPLVGNEFAAQPQRDILFHQRRNQQRYEEDARDRQ